MPNTSLRRAVVALAAAAAVAPVAPALAADRGGPVQASPAVERAAAAPTTAGQGGRPTTTTPRRASTTSSTVPGARAAAKQRVDVLRSSRAQVRSELDAIERRIAEVDAELVALQAEADSARAVAQEAAQRGEVAAEKADVARGQVRDYAVEAFIRPPAEKSLAVLSISSAEDASYAQDVLGIMADTRRGVVDEMVAARAVAERERAAASAAAEVASARVGDVRGRLDELEQLRAEQGSIAADLEDRLDAALAESAALAAIDAKAAAELAAREAALREQAKPPVTAAPRRGAPVRTTTPPRSSTPAPKPSTGGGSGGQPGGIVTWTDVTRVGGIWVHHSIAGQVRGLLDAATAAGFSLSGGGFRDPSEQITLRRAHCGPTDYDIWQKPASQCTPPTARPGTSMHERGLAMDLMSSGKLITSRADPAFQWLAANAGRYGFKNLPSEPWHWSTNGN